MYSACPETPSARPSFGLCTKHMPCFYAVAFTEIIRHTCRKWLCASPSLSSEYAEYPWCILRAAAQQNCMMLTGAVQRAAAAASSSGHITHMWRCLLWLCDCVTSSSAAPTSVTWTATTPTPTTAYYCYMLSTMTNTTRIAELLQLLRHPLTSWIRTYATSQSCVFWSVSINSQLVQFLDNAASSSARCLVLTKAMRFDWHTNRLKHSDQPFFPQRTRPTDRLAVSMLCCVVMWPSTPSPNLPHVCVRMHRDPINPCPKLRLRCGHMPQRDDTRRDDVPTNVQKHQSGRRKCSCGCMHKYVYIFVCTKAPQRSSRSTPVLDRSLVALVCLCPLSYSLSVFRCAFCLVILHPKCKALEWDGLDFMQSSWLNPALLAFAILALKVGKCLSGHYYHCFLATRPSRAYIE